LVRPVIAAIQSELNLSVRRQAQGFKLRGLQTSDARLQPLICSPSARWEFDRVGATLYTA